MAHRVCVSKSKKIKDIDVYLITFKNTEFTQISRRVSVQTGPLYGDNTTVRTDIMILKAILARLKPSGFLKSRTVTFLFQYSTMLFTVTCVCVSLPCLLTRVSVPLCCVHCNFC
jgi:hypothetical protein